MLTGLIQSLMVCVMTHTGDMTECVEILNDIVAEATVSEEEQKEEKRYTIGVVGFPEDSLANEIVNYWYAQSNGDMDMILTFIAENGNFDHTKVSKTNDRGLCMLHRNKTNRKRIEDERWNDPMYQAEVCIDKRQAVPNPSKVWYGWKVRNRYKDRIYFF